MSIFIPIIIGTAREGRKTEAVANWIYSSLKNQEGLQTELVDIRDFPMSNKTLPAWEDHDATQDWKALTSKADGFFFVIPEYNHGYPGEMKLLLDSAYKEYFHKPVALAGVSAGRLGGARVLEHIKPVLIELEMTILKDHLYVSNINDMIKDGAFTPKDDSFDKQLKRILKKLTVYSKSLRDVREQLLDK